MTSDDVLVLGWLLLAHLVADFLLQTDRMVADKQADGARAWRGLGVHGGAVGLSLAPFAVVYGVRGLALVAVVTAGHVLIDRWKVGATRDAALRAAPTPVRVGSADLEAAEAPEALGPAWTPMPAVLFVLDQVFHLVLIALAWLVLLAPAQPTDAWLAFTEGLTAGLPPEELHRAALGGVVLAALVIVNVRGGLFFVATLVGPGTRNGDRPVLQPPAPPPPLPAAWRVRVGPIEAVAQPGRPNGLPLRRRLRLPTPRRPASGPRSASSSGC